LANFSKTLKELYDDYIYKNVGLKNDKSLDIKELVRNDPIMCPCCYEHRMNNFRKLILNTNLRFGQVKDYFFIIESRGLPHDHDLLWIENATRYGVFQNEKNECLVDKYLATN